VQLICCYFSPLLVDTLKKHAVEGDVAVECVYFALAALEEQALATVVGSCLNRVLMDWGRFRKKGSKLFEAEGMSLVAGEKQWSSYRKYRPHDVYLYALMP